MISRKFAATVPLFLLFGIIVQVVVLVLVVVFYIPILIWPVLLDRPVKKIWKSVARGMFRGKRKIPDADEKVSFL